MKTPFSHSQLLEWLHYDPDTGIFTWRKRAASHVPAGSRGGGLSVYGYGQIGFMLKRYRTARLAWFYMTGKWPAEVVDHKNMNRADDRWENLRAASDIQNRYNTKAKATNSLGVKGVVKCKNGKFRATIKVDGRQKHLGYFVDSSSASDAYASSAMKHFGDFARSK